MQFTPYLSFNGNCEEAFKFYEQTLGGELQSMFRYEGSPMQDRVPAEWRQKVMHTTLKAGDGVLMGADAPPPYFTQPGGFSVSIVFKEPAEAESKFEALGKGGKIMMPIQQTFWARRFGMLVDRFGIPWMVSCE